MPIYGIIQRLKGHVYRIGGMPDHVHILTALPPNISVSDAVKTIKQSSSIWLKGSPDFPVWRGWTNGYAVMSYSQQDVPTVREYIVNQKMHHASVAFADEYETLVKSMGYESVIDE